VKILVLGSGAREHALVASLARENAHEIVVAPGNPGMESVAERIRIDQTNPELIADFVRDEAVELLVIGPEAPLVAGVADAVRELGVPVFGPSKAAAALEGSKAYAKDIMQRAGVPTGRAVQRAELSEVIATLDEFGAPYVIKADGLASGKGVIVTDDRTDAITHAEHWLAQGPVLIEEFLDGSEVSLFCFSDGETVRALPPAQDFKRLYDNDAGPNTGGMGAYTPVPFLIDQFGGEREFMNLVVEQVAQPVVDTMRADGVPFQGLLYCGLIVTAAGIRVIEFNARFGDPETQVVLERLAEPLSPLLLESANGTLGSHDRDLAIGDGAAVTVVLASEGYPDKVRSGRELAGLDDAEATGARVLHAATGVADEATVATGGRVLNVVATGDTLQAARRGAYAALGLIRLEGGQFRTDIAQLGAALQDSQLARSGSISLSAARDDAATTDSIAIQAADTLPAGAPVEPQEPEVEAPSEAWDEPTVRMETPIAAAVAAQTGETQLTETQLAETQPEPASAPAATASAPQLPGWRHVYTGKVREVYESEAEPDVLLVVASNRVSAFDHLLEPEIPGKGRMLTQLSRWWFSQLPTGNHLREREGWDAQLDPEIAERSMRVAKLQMFPIECVVRGYLTGSGLAEYRETGKVCGVALPAGLEDGDRLPAPIYTPAYKAPQGEHDENISYARTVELVGEQHAAALRELSLRLYTAGSTISAEQGLVLADTKFEFGLDSRGEIVLADEALTSDSSRYWDKRRYNDDTSPLAERLASFDKQIVRNWLRENWNGEGTPPRLPDEIVEQTAAKYRELIERLTADPE
jgi:phosphoribosylamine--glycine ligase